MVLPTTHRGPGLWDEVWSEDAVVVFARSCGSVCKKPPTQVPPLSPSGVGHTILRTSKPRAAKPTIPSQKRVTQQLTTHWPLFKALRQTFPTHASRNSFSFISESSATESEGHGPGLCSPPRTRTLFSVLEPERAIGACVLAGQRGLPAHGASLLFYGPLCPIRPATDKWAGGSADMCTRTGALLRCARQRPWSTTHSPVRREAWPRGASMRACMSAIQATAICIPHSKVNPNRGILCMSQTRLLRLACTYALSTLIMRICQSRSRLTSNCTRRPLSRSLILASPLISMPVSVSKVLTSPAPWQSSRQRGHHKDESYSPSSESFVVDPKYITAPLLSSARSFTHGELCQKNCWNTVQQQKRGVAGEERGSGVLMCNLRVVGAA